MNRCLDRAVEILQGRRRPAGREHIETASAHAGHWSSPSNQRLRPIPEPHGLTGAEVFASHSLHKKAQHEFVEFQHGVLKSDTISLTNNNTGVSAALLANSRCKHQIGLLLARGVDSHEQTTRAAAKQNIRLSVWAVEEGGPLEQTNFLSDLNSRVAGVFEFEK